MAHDQNTRNRLQRFVSEARDLLSGEFARQFQQKYGLDASSGEVSELERLVHLNDRELETARMLRDNLAHYLASSPSGGKRECLERMIREQAFTVLNRLCALRMAEAREIIIESLSRTYNSKGFQLYARLAGTALGETGDAYRAYIFSLFDELALDLPVLFDRFSPQGYLFPGEGVLLELLAMMNESDLSPLWVEDETIGWIYQYFNSLDERRQMRSESQAPRNSRELAVRNQFFTPRYVVEFLTDNTLGRLWYEMTRGETQLKDSCSYLVRRPQEIFLAAGEEAPEIEESTDDLSQEEMLQQAVYIPYRPLKDPREILMLDPACGSMHFGLYAFDLYEKIYEEAWDMESQLGSQAFERSENLKPLQQTYASREEFLCDVPRLIIECNIHGVDIDSRAVQIAGLSLWLRAQRSWLCQGLKPQHRPQIRKSNVVCAEPMPGEKGMLEEFAGKLKPRVLGQLVEMIFDKMQLAGEAGSLLKIEEEIEEALNLAREEFQKEIQFRNEDRSTLFPDIIPPRQASLFDFTDLGDKTRFWNCAEERLLDALREYSEQAGDTDSVQKRLFAQDAARGFAFIDLFQKKYDVVLMNPPFGLPPNSVTQVLTMAYPKMKSDMAAAFIERCLMLINNSGFQGVLHPRNLYYIGDFISWRSDVLLQKADFVTAADLGLGVLDDALVEVSAAVFNRNGYSVTNSGLFFRLLSHANKESILYQMILESLNTDDVFDIPSRYFLTVPGFRICYWLSTNILEMYSALCSFKKQVGVVRQGLATGDDYRFYRVWWEISFNRDNKEWVPISKGGEYSPFIDDIHLVANWKKDGEEYWNFINPRTGRSFSNIWMLPGTISKHFFNPGISFPQRTTSGFAPKILPQGSIFSHMSMTIFPNSEENLQLTLMLTNSRVFSLFVEAGVGGGDTVTSGSAARRFTQNIIEGVPVPEINKMDKQVLNELGQKIEELSYKDFLSDETNRNFICPFLTLLPYGYSLNELFLADLNEREKRHLGIIEASGQVDQILLRLYKINKQQEKTINTEVGIHPSKYFGKVENEDIDNLSLAFTLPLDQCIRDLASKSISPRRELTKKVYIIDRRLEVLSHFYKIHPQELQAIRANLKLYCREEYAESVSSIISYCLGSIFGLWDIRYSIGQKELSELPNPFDPLYTCPPGVLQNGQGLPAIVQELPTDYPLWISWSGILVDDEGYPEDIVARVREAIEVIWKEKAGDIEQEACEILGVDSLRDYFRKHGNFFAEHLKRYSKSRRQAPIYWPLSTASGSYTIWLYYQRLDGQTLYRCVNDYVEPKLKQVMESTRQLRQKGGRSRQEERELEELLNLEQELQEFRDELLQVATFWKPDLNDGVQITAAPLWKLFRLPKWRTTLKETWGKLEKGDYDWAHLAYSIWPERVREKCKHDKSLAIAHELEDIYEEPVAQAKKKGGRSKKNT